MRSVINHSNANANASFLLFSAMALGLLLGLWAFQSRPLMAQGGHAGHGGHGGHGESPALSAPEAAPDDGAFRPGIYSAEGMVISVNREGSSLVLEHGPIAAVNWEAMTMGFKVEYASLLDEIKAGDRVRFDLRFLSPTQYAVSDIESLN